MKRKSILLAALAFICLSEGMGQRISYSQSNEFILAETKQVNQFFSRFNGEEDYEGKRISRQDPEYRDIKLRQTYIANLFDNLSRRMPDTLKENFIHAVTEGHRPIFLNHRKNDWYAQLDVIIRYENKEHPCTLFLKMERENMGTKWVLANVYFRPFTKLFEGVDFFSGSNGKKSNPYLHPKSHEIDFVNLKKAFQNIDEIEKYAAREYNPDYLTLLIYELKRGSAELLNVKNLKFHFFQVDNWYFELSELTRKNMNSGWLISDLMRVQEKDKEVLRKYIFFHENNHSSYSP